MTTATTPLADAVATMRRALAAVAADADELAGRLEPGTREHTLVLNVQSSALRALRGRG